jgi:uncharacterized protein (TIGR00304 family)
MKLITLGFLVMLLGVLLIMLGVFSQAYHSWKTTGSAEQLENGVRAGGVIMIGPIPLIFGSDPGALKLAIILAIVLMALALILMYLPRLV